MLLVLFGARSPLVVDYEETAQRLERSVAIVSAQGSGPARVLNRKALLSEEDVPTLGNISGFVACAFNPARRTALATRAQALGLSPAPALVDPHAVLARSSRMGAGCFVNAGVVIGGASRIGAHAVINRSASLGHHCLIEDFVSIGPGVHMASNVRIGSGAIIGTGATILPDVRIGAQAIVAAGSVVRRDVGDGVLVAGNPAKSRDYDRAAGLFGHEDAE